MKIEIWSDIVCPFCYIGKRRFEKALKKFEHKDEVKIIWRSFQLNPNLKTDPNITIHQYLANIKGISLEQAKKMNDQVSAMAKEVGLEYNLDNAKVANTFDAHRLMHLAKRYDLQNSAKEMLLSAYFTNGENVADPSFLIHLGKSIGIDESEVVQMLESNLYADEVKMDALEAGKFGARGVPFFVFDRKYAISGAQPIEVFLDVLNKSYSEWSLKKIKA